MFSSRCIILDGLCLCRWSKMLIHLFMVAIAGNFFRKSHAPILTFLFVSFGLFWILIFVNLLFLESRLRCWVKNISLVWMERWHYDEHKNCRKWLKNCRWMFLSLHACKRFCSLHFNPTSLPLFHYDPTDWIMSSIWSLAALVLRFHWLFCFN